MSLSKVARTPRFTPGTILAIDRVTRMTASSGTILPRATYRGPNRQGLQFRVVRLMEAGYVDT